MSPRPTTPWTLDQLCQTLHFGEPLPGDSHLLTYEIESNINHRRSMLALSCLMRHFASSSTAINTIHKVALSGNDSYLRIACLRALEQLMPIDSLIRELLDDEEPDVRVFAIEYMFVNYPAETESMIPMLKGDCDIRVHEILYCVREKKPLPEFFS